MVYQIYSYINETGRSFSTRCREHVRDVDGWKPNRSALSKHVNLNDHKIDWVNIKILAQENDYYKRKFLESFNINKCDSTLNIKSNGYFPSPHETI